MATIKSYTDLSQSKKLADILPLKSADMYYFDNIPYCKYIEEDRDYWYVSHDYILAWSLATLLDVLPNNEHITTTISRGSWKIDTIEYMPNTWWCEYEDEESQTYFNTSADNPVDACYEMILKLNELKKL